MATHDYIVDNQNGANFRSDLNNALAAIVSNNSSATAPTTTYAFMLWADTASDLLKQRNAADSAWISILTLSTGAPLGTLSSSLLSGALPAIDGSSLTNLPAPTGLDSSGGVARATSGLLFNADTAAANALDDYEEGTFTATLRGSTAEPATLSTSTTAFYVKIGRAVHFSIAIDNKDTTGYSGYVSITGLPFAAGAGRHILSINTYKGVTFTETLGAQLTSAQTTIAIYSIRSNNSYLSATHNPLAGTYFWVTGTYRT